MVAGELAKDAVWDGPVEIGGDVVVPAGRSLRIMPGARLSFAERPRWSCAVFRSAPEGWPIEASYRELCDVVVFGRLEIEGAELSGRWGGITVLGSGSARLWSASLSGATEFLIEAFDDARVEAVNSRFFDSKIGVLAWGLSSVSLTRCRFERLESCVLCREGSRADLREVAFSGARQGVWTQHWALARAKDCAFENCDDFGAGSYERSRVELSGGAMKDCGRGVVAG